MLCTFVALDGHNPRKDNSLLYKHTDTRIHQITKKTKKYVNNSRAKERKDKKKKRDFCLTLNFET